MLFNNLEELKPFLSVNMGFTFENMESFIYEVEQRFIKPILGKTLFDKLQAGYDVASELPAHLDLLRQARYAIANLAFNRYLPWAAVQISDSGIRVPIGDDHRPATEKQLIRLAESSLNNGYEHLEWMVKFLEENIIDYPEWTYAQSHRYFINSASQFSEYCQIHESRLIYLKMLM